MPSLAMDPDPSHEPFLPLAHERSDALRRHRAFDKIADSCWNGLEVSDESTCAVRSILFLSKLVVVVFFCNAGLTL